MLTLFVITWIVYGLTRNMPGTPLTVTLGETDPSRKLNPADIERMKKAYGLDKPWYEAYCIWLGNVVQEILAVRFRVNNPWPRSLENASDQRLHFREPRSC